MRVIKAHIENFGSFEELDVNYSSSGLTLISGATGSGKSTFCDIIPWALFGKTSKDGAVDDVISWNAKGQTSVQVVIEIGGKKITITRTRKSNDLFYAIDGEVYRGKDLKDTQDRINNLLGITPLAYLSGAYYHEFSETAAFFTASANERRSIMELLTDLTLPKLLSENLSGYKKEIKKDLDDLILAAAQNNSALNTVQQAVGTDTKRAEAWDDQHAVAVQALVQKAKTQQMEYGKKMSALTRAADEFEVERGAKIIMIGYEVNDVRALLVDLPSLTSKAADLQQKIASLQGQKCDKCGADTTAETKSRLTTELMVLERQISKLKSNEQTLASLERDQKRVEREENPYRRDLAKLSSELPVDLTERLEALRNQTNPHLASLEANKREQRRLKTQSEAHQNAIDTVKDEITDADLLTDVNAALRSTLVKNTVTQLQDGTNKLLERHFDAEIRVEFITSDNDKLALVITKDGNTCNYTQLSKGQRCLLKLCFGISVMRVVSNHKGVQFNAVFFDEALSGLDTELKLKAFELFKSLSKDYESIYIVEHDSDLKAMFENEIAVMLVDGRSKVNGHQT